MLRKQQRQALLLDNFFTLNGLAGGRSLRERKSVTYTFGKNVQTHFYMLLHLPCVLDIFLPYKILLIYLFISSLGKVLKDLVDSSRR